MLLDKDYADADQIMDGTSETVKAKIKATDVTGKIHSKEMTVVYDKEQVESADVLQDLSKEIEEEFEEDQVTYQFQEKLFTDKIVTFAVKRVRE